MFLLTFNPRHEIEIMVGREKPVKEEREELQMGEKVQFRRKFSSVSLFFFAADACLHTHTHTHTHTQKSV